MAGFKIKRLYDYITALMTGLKHSACGLDE
jgi:hypothetical protein